MLLILLTTHRTSWKQHAYPCWWCDYHCTFLLPDGTGWVLKASTPPPPSGFQALSLHQLCLFLLTQTGHGQWAAEQVWLWAQKSEQIRPRRKKWHLWDNYQDFQSTFKKQRKPQLVLGLQNGLTRIVKKCIWNHDHAFVRGHGSTSQHWLTACEGF